MGESKVTPNTLARDLSRRLGRQVTAKSVRGFARDNIARFDKTRHPEYQSHEYSAAESRTITAGFLARAGRSRAQTKPTAKNGASKRAMTAKVESEHRPVSKAGPSVTVS